LQNPIHILLVEDDPDDVELLQSAFKECNIASTFHVIMQGDKVLPWLASQKTLPNIIVLDLNLPKVHGKQILKSICEHESYKHLPIVILTTSSAQHEKDYCLSEGAADFLIKPVTLEGYQTVVNSIVKNAAS